MARISFKWFEFGFECFESLSNVSNLLSNAANPFRMVWICIRMLPSPFECYKFGSCASNLVRMLEIRFEWLEFAFEGFESLSSASNVDSNASNPFVMLRICIRTVRIPFESLEFAFECFESLSNASNLDSNSSNLVWRVRIWIRMLRMPFEFALEWFKSLSNG